jgi:hypothetical protein
LSGIKKSGNSLSPSLQPAIRYRAKDLPRKLQKAMPSPTPSNYRARTALPVVSPGLRRRRAVVLALFGLLAVNSLYLVVIDAAGRLSGHSYEKYFYLSMFLAHLGPGLVLLVPAPVCMVPSRCRQGAWV